MAYVPPSYYNNPNPNEQSDEQWYRSLMDPATGGAPVVDVTGEKRSQVAKVDDVVDEPPPVPVEPQPAPVAEPPAAYNPDAAPPAPDQAANPEPAPDISQLGQGKTETGDFLDSAEEPPPSPAAAAAPAGDTDTASYEAEKAARGEQPKEWHSSLVSTKPTWYDDKAPPDEPTWAKVLLGLGASGLMAGLAPDKKSAIAAGLGGALQTAGAVIDDPNRNYQHRLAAADKQSDMHAKLAGGRGAGLGAANLDLARQRFEFAKQQYADKQKLSADMRDPNSAITKQYQDAAIETGVLPEERARKLTAFQLDEYRPQAGQAAAQGRGFENSKELKNMGHTQGVERIILQDELGKEGEIRTEERKLGAEDRERVAGLETAYIPGRQWRAGRAPNTAMTTYAQKINEKAQGVQYASQKLEEIQNKLNLVAQAGGDIYTVLGSDEEQKQLLADAKMYVEMIGAGLRAEEGLNFGVPQKYELEVLENVNPKADNILTYFKGPYAYRAMGKVIGELADHRLTQLGSVPDNGSEPEKPRTRPAKTGQQRLQEAGAQLGKGGEVLNNAVTTGKQIAGNVAETVEGLGASPVAQQVKKQFKIVTATGKEYVKEMSDAAAEALSQQKDKIKSIVPVQ